MRTFGNGKCKACTTDRTVRKGFGGGVGGRRRRGRSHERARNLLCHDTAAARAQDAPLLRDASHACTLTSCVRRLCGSHAAFFKQPC